MYTAFTRARVSLFMYDSDEEKRLPMFHLLLTQQLVKRVSMSSVQEELEGEMAIFFTVLVGKISLPMCCLTP